MTISLEREHPPEHDLTRASYSPHATDGGGPLVFDNRCRRCWYGLANVQLAALLEAAKKTMAATQRLLLCPLCHEPECDCWNELAIAIAAFEGGTP